MNKKEVLRKLLVSITAMGVGLTTTGKVLAKNSMEKCYGVAKAGKNDCAAADGSYGCSGQEDQNGSGNAWIYVPKGTCNKIVGGSLKPFKDKMHKQDEDEHAASSEDKMHEQDEDEHAASSEDNKKTS